MSSTKAILAAAAICFASSINAHMIMRTPVPYGRDSLDNSPLHNNGDDFPCKLRKDTYNSDGVSNIMPIGVSQTLNFFGSAVHGGGSCQISLTTDKTPDKSTQWQVIHSIEGGCPANVPGNLEPESATGVNASTFEYVIPEGIATGDYTLAWTWFNKVGNREMYMNCAPITVTSGSGKREADAENPGFTERATSFPPMFLANIGNGCSTDVSASLSFPNPGASVQKLDNENFVPPIGNCATGDSVAPSGGSAASSASGSASTPATSAVQPAPSGGVFAGGADPASSSSPAVSTTPAAAAPSTPPAAPSPSGTTSTAGALTGPCTAEGDWNCIGGNSFQRCASGAWSIAQPMASGTTCQSGQSATLSMSAAAVKHKKAIRFSRGHVKRGLSANL